MVNGKIKLAFTTSNELKVNKSEKIFGAKQ